MGVSVQFPDLAPSALDRVISFVSPEWGLRRLRARAGLQVAASYTGARGDRRSLKQWSPSSGSANADTLLDLPILRARSRDLVRNSPLAGGAVGSVVTNVIGTGLRLQPQVDRELLGLDEEEADAWERRTLQVWRAWAESENCDVTRIQNFAGLQDLAFRSTLESGDVLTVRRFVARQGDVLATKIQLIEGDRISNPYYKPDARLLAGGVEVDGNGAPRWYHVRNTHPGEIWGLWRGDQWARVPVRGPQSSDRLAILLYARRRPGQLRGVPYLAPVIEPLKQLERYTEAELTATVISSMFTVFVKAEAEGGLAPIDATDPNPPETHEYKLGSGAILDLMPGEDIETANPMRPNQAFDPFVQAVLRQVGVGLELPFEVLIKHFTASYSAARAAILDAWMFYRSRREWVATSFCQPCYEWVVTEAIARGLLRAPGFDNPVLRRGWLRALWVGPAMGQIDPKKEVDAAKTRVDIGVSTLAEETVALTGGDWEQKHKQRVKEERMRRQDGLTGEVVAERIQTEPRQPIPAEEEDDGGPDQEGADRG